MYVPILQIEPGQLDGLSATSAPVKSAMTPLFDVGPADVRPTGDEPFGAAVTALVAAWAGRPAYVDCRTGRGDERLPDGRVHLAALIDCASAVSLPLVPVTGLRRPMAHQLAAADAAATEERGACLRLELVDFQTPTGIEHGVDRFLDTAGIAAEQLDLVVDLGDVGHAPVGLLEVTVHAVLRPLARIAPWRSVTLAGSTAGFGAGRRTVERTEWLLWRAVAAGATVNGRPVRFGDHGVRDGRWLHYTHDAEWLVVDAAANGSSRGGSPALRDLIRQPEFHPAHCAGDASFVEAVAGSPVDPARWLAAATTHHLTTVVEQLAGE